MTTLQTKVPNTFQCVNIRIKVSELTKLYFQNVATLKIYLTYMSVLLKCNVKQKLTISHYLTTTLKSPGH